MKIAETGEKIPDLSILKESLRSFLQLDEQNFRAYYIELFGILYSYVLSLESSNKNSYLTIRQ
jgi:hypothetical protein